VLQQYSKVFSVSTENGCVYHGNVGEERRVYSKTPLDSQFIIEVVGQEKENGPVFRSDFVVDVCDVGKY
jgi:hypothetical protein